MKSVDELSSLCSQKYMLPFELNKKKYLLRALNYFLDFH